MIKTKEKKTIKKPRPQFYTKANQIIKTGAPVDVIYDLKEEYNISIDEIKKFLKIKPISSAVSQSIVASKTELEIIYNTLDQKFIEQHDNIVLYIRGENNEFYQYQNGVYVELTGTDMYNLVDSIMAQYTLLSYRSSKRKVEDTVRRIAALLSRTPKRFFTDNQIKKQPYRLNVQNGLLNMTTQKLTSHSPDYFSTVQVSFPYDTTAVCPEFDKFITEVSDDDKSTAQMIQEMYGYCLEEGNPKHRVFYLYGLTARNGKSTVAKIITKIIGEGNYSTLSLSQLAGENSSVLTSLIDKQLNFSDELSSKYIDSSRLTAISSEGIVEINPKFKKAFLYQVKAKFIITCNDLPRFKDSQGMKNRMISIPFPRQFKEIERSTKERLDEILVEKEGSGILNWAIKGNKKLKKNRVFSVNKQSEEDMKENLHQSNPTYAYLELMYDFNESYDIEYTAKELYGEEEKRVRDTTLEATGFRLFHKEHGIRNLSFFVFAKELSRFASETKKIKKVQKREGVKYIGMSLKKANKGEEESESEKSIIQKEFNNL